jgi:YscO-like protein
MTLPRYRLQPVLDSKEKRKKETEKHLAEVRKEVARQEKILQEKEAAVVQAVQKKDQYVADFQTKLNAGMETGKITAAKAYIELLKKNIELAKKKVEEQKKVIEEWKNKEQEALHQVTEATKEMKVIEKHKENWSDSVKKEIEFNEEKEQEEVAQNLYEQFRRQKQS